MAFTIFSWHSLKTRMTFLSLVILLSSLWSLSFYSSRMLYGDVEKISGEQQLSTVSLLAAHLNQEISIRLTALEEIAETIHPATMGNAPSLQTFLEHRILVKNFFNEGMLVYSLDGTAIAAAPFASLRVGLNYMDRDYLVGAIKEDKATIGLPLIGRTAKAPIFVMAVPIHDSKGNVIGALSGITNLDKPNFLDGITQSRYGESGGYLIVSPRTRTIITATDKSRAMEILPEPGINPLIDRFILGYEGSGIVVSPQGVEVLASAKAIPVAGWYVAGVLPTEEAFAPIRFMQHRMLLTTFFLAFLSSILTWWAVRRQLSPLVAASNTLATFSASNRKLEPLPIVRKDEIGKVIDEFNQALKTNEEREYALRESEARFRLLSEHSPTAMVVHRDWKILYINAKFVAMMGKHPDGFLGQSVLERVHPDFLEQTIHHIDTMDSEVGHVDPADLKMITLGGRVIDVETCSIRVDFDGKPAVFSMLLDITHRKQLEIEILEKQNTLRSILDHAPVAIWLLNQNQQLEFANKVCCEAAGIPEDVFTSAPDYSVLYDAETAARFRTADTEAFAADGPHVSAERVLFADGQMHDIEVIRIRLCDDRGLPTGKLVVLSTDVTERKTAERRLKLLAAVFENAREGITVSDSEGTIIEVNPRFCEITGYSREDVIGKNPRILKSGRQDDVFYSAMWRSILSTGYWRGEIWNRRKDGEIYPEILSIAKLEIAASSPAHYLAVFSDISDIKSHQARLEHLAHFDALTHLPNRVLLADRLQIAISYARRNELLLAVCFLDLDGFKQINDHYGHQFGDQLLVEVAQRLSDTLRGGDSVARIGGDEFILILGDLQSLGECDAAVKRILKILSEPCIIKGQTVKVSASIGVTLFPEDDVNVDTLLRHADQALYIAKDDGRNCYRLFDTSHDQGLRVRREGLAQFQVALASNQLRLHYQPKVDMRRGEVIGAEALIRWQHPERGLLSPALFLPAIENSEADIALGEWVIQEALGQLNNWHLVGLDLTVSVNISAYHLAQKSFFSRLKSFLEAYPGLPAHSLEIEILETAALEDITHIVTLMTECQTIGVNFALDDFGTGYSSLSYFKRLPASMLKIDQSFIQDMLTNSDDLAIVQGIISLTRAFRRSVIAEGVETIEHGVMLLQMGCDLAQGYGIARPMPGEEMILWQAKWRPDEAWIRAAGLSFSLVDIDLIMAEKYHQQWLEQLKSFLLSDLCEKQLPPHLDKSHCRVDDWFDGVGKQRFGEMAEFSDTKYIHDMFHDVSGELVVLHKNGQVITARSRIGDLETISAELSGSLNTLMISITME